MRKLALGAALALFGCASVTAPSPEAVRDLAPGGKLRAAINVGNPVLAKRGAGGGDPTGVSVDIARELAARLGVPVEFHVFDAAGKVVEAGKSGAWDVGFVAIDPKRSEDIEQSSPYVVIEGAYVVPQASPIRDNAEVDRAGNRIVVGRGSAYDLFLTRTIKQAELVRVQVSPMVVQTVVAQHYEVGAGVKQQLEADVQRTPGARLLPGRFMVINQAMASQHGKRAGARYVREFIEDLKASGFVARALERHGVQGAAVAPAGDAM